MPGVPLKKCNFRIFEIFENKKIKENQCPRRNFKLEEEEELTYIFYMLLETHIQNFCQIHSEIPKLHSKKSKKINVHGEILS